MATTNSGWQYTANQFETCTAQSKKRMNNIIVDHDDKLSAAVADADILTLYNLIHPHRLNYTGKYSGWMTAKALYSSKTLAVENKIGILSSDKVEFWDVSVQVVYRRGTVEYQAIFPALRAPFQTGSIDDRIAACNSLSTNMGTDAALAAIKADVDTFRAALSLLRTQQQQLEQQLSQKSDELETERVLCAKAMHKSVGGLIVKYAEGDLEIAESFFDLEEIRKTGADEDPAYIEIIALANSTTVAADVTWELNATLRLQNKNATHAVEVCTSLLPDDPCAQVWTLAPNSDVLKPTIELGPANATVLKFTNNTPQDIIIWVSVV